jgi:hypothetical protein
MFLVLVEKEQSAVHRDLWWKADTCKRLLANSQFLKLFVYSYHK